MATINLTKLEHTLDLANSGVSLASQGIDYSQSTASRVETEWGWTSPSNYQSVFGGTGFNYSDGVPTKGTVTSLHLNLTTSAFADDLVVTGLTVALSAFAPLANQSLSSEQQNDLYWKLVLSGADTIPLGNLTTENSQAVSIAGDGRNWTSSTAHGVHDVITGDVGHGIASGDFFDIATGATVYGGDDSLTVTGYADFFNSTLSYALGDALTVSGVLVGGNDTLASSDVAYTAGDAYVVAQGGGVIGGDDTLFAGLYATCGDVVYVLGSLIGGNDTFNGDDGPNDMYGDALEVTELGFAKGGDDTLHGGGGEDYMFGDWDAERVQGNVIGGNDKLYGDAGNDGLFGNAGDDLLDGGADVDTLDGGEGSDTYIVDNVGDKVTEANVAGIDTVNASVTFSLAGQYVEKLTLTGTAAINATGNSLANTIVGNSAANTINGGTGADKMAGGGGNDIYFVDNVGDVVTEANVTGVDTVNASVTFSLAGQYVEKLTLTGTAAINATGNSLANTIVGNAAANIIAGGTGNDDLTGGGGKDSFLFNTALNASTNVDIVHSYSVTDDTFQLARSIFTGFNGFGQATPGRFFTNNTGLAHDADDRIIYETDSGKLFYDADGTGVTAGVHFATVATGLGLTNADFVIV